MSSLKIDIFFAYFLNGKYFDGLDYSQKLVLDRLMVSISGSSGIFVIFPVLFVDPDLGTV